MKLISIDYPKEPDNTCPKCGGNDYITKSAGDETYRECNDCKYYSGE